MGINRPKDAFRNIVDVKLLNRESLHRQRVSLHHTKTRGSALPPLSMSSTTPRVYTTLPWPNQPMHQAPLHRLKTVTQAVTTIRVSLHHTSTQGFRFTIQSHKCSDVSRPTTVIQAHQGFRFTIQAQKSPLRCVVEACLPTARF